MLRQIFLINLRNHIRRECTNGHCVHQLNQRFQLSLTPTKRFFTTPPVKTISNTLPSTAKIDNTEKLYILSQNDPDNFGPHIHHATDEIEDAGDVAEENFTQNPPKSSQKLSIKQYADLIKDHLKNNRIKEAIDVLEVRMKEDRVKPVNYIFNLLIGGCGRVGYSKKAFSLYNRMKQHGLKVTGGTYTSLFNACATAPWIEDGLNKANRLREIMHEKGYIPNASNYNAMIKAYGRCGDIQTAFELVDEMKDKQLDIQIDTFNFLLQACASDKDHGFRYALLVWRKIFQRKLIPDIYSYNLMLRCVRDCATGELETMESVIQQILIDTSVNQPKLLEMNTNPSAEIQSIIDADSSNIQITESNFDAIPNLLSKVPNMGNLIKLNEIRYAEERLLLIGGANGFLREMEWAKVTPTIKTFTAMLDVIPSTFSAEKALIANLRRMHIKCDIDFFNILMKKRSMRFDYEGAKAVLPMIKTASLNPDIMTYGILSLGCKTLDEARAFIQDMFNKGHRLNIEIIGTLLKNACFARDFAYVQHMMRIVKSERIKPNEEFLTTLYTFSRYCSSMIRNNNKMAHENNFQSKYHKFQDELVKWKQFMGLERLKLSEAIEEVREHPWEQFKSNQSDGMESVKNPKARHQRKLRRHIQRIKPDKLIDTTDEGEQQKNAKTSQLEIKT